MENYRQKVHEVVQYYRVILHNKQIRVEGELMYKNFLKRTIDLILSLIGLVVLSPVFLIIALTIKVDDPGPVFFKQKRIGIHKSYFSLYKFRSMKVKQRFQNS